MVYNNEDFVRQLLAYYQFVIADAFTGKVHINR